eukprot:GHUV01015018.1.p2 GENE.GHUV01015018.1~~GHUV01015018.1.p2  ORF type:complete len:127 (-),score=22.06 GHUV01015018.1:1348-1728(-)
MRAGVSAEMASSTCTIKLHTHWNPVPTVENACSSIHTCNFEEFIRTILPCCLQLWPTDMVPPRPVGKMVLDTNIDNFFAEAEQIAFCPAVVVPGGALVCFGMSCVPARKLAKRLISSCCMQQWCKW